VVAVVSDASPPDAAVPVPIDAAPMPIDAPTRRTHRSHAPVPPRADSGSNTTPPGCDRSIDTDCDGIPDVR